MLAFESIEELENNLKKSLLLHVKKPHALCDSYWDSFLEQLPSVLENLNKMLLIFSRMTLPLIVSKSIFSIPGFYAIAIYRLSHII
jgi:serine O-acetyltransferase